MNKFALLRVRIITLATLLLSLFTSMCLSANAQDSSKGLKDYYKSYFPMGVAIRPQSVAGPEAELILKHFESVTAENAMKMGPIHPKEDEFFWADADAIVNFAQTNKLKIRGHTLCWHNQTPAWLFKDAQGGDVTKEVLLKRLKDHITAVVGRIQRKDLRLGCRQ